MLEILFVIICVGIALGVVNTVIPMDSRVRQIFNAVVLIILIVWLFKVFGVWGHLGRIHI